MIPVVIIGRTIAVLTAYFVMSPCNPVKLSLRELLFISYGGMIRGAIAFALVLKIPEEPIHFPERDVIITTTLALVIFTTLVFGTFMNMVQKILVPVNNNKVISLSIQANPSGEHEDHHEVHIHPNMENDLEKPMVEGSEPVVRDCGYFLAQMDINYFRPWFILNY